MWYNDGMEKILQFIRKVTNIKVALPILWTLIVLLVLAWVFVFVILVKPDWFNFQPSFGQNVSTLAMMLTALSTLILASAAFQSIHSSKEQEKHRREDRLLNDILQWAIDL